MLFSFVFTSINKKVCSSKWNYTPKNAAPFVATQIQSHAESARKQSLHFCQSKNARLQHGHYEFVSQGNNTILATQNQQKLETSAFSLFCWYAILTENPP